MCLTRRVAPNRSTAAAAPNLFLAYRCCCCARISGPAFLASAPPELAWSPNPHQHAAPFCSALLSLAAL
eukprot:1160461-Pelagomonas_calceolata.AAC.10